MKCPTRASVKESNNNNISKKGNFDKSLRDNEGVIDKDKNKKEVCKMNILNNEQDINVKTSMTIFGESDSSILNNIGYKLVIPRSELQNQRMLKEIYCELDEDDVVVTISEAYISFKAIYKRPIPILTLLGLGISKGYGTNVAKYISATFGISECEVINLYCYEDVSVEDIE